MSDKDDNLNEDVNDYEDYDKSLDYNKEKNSKDDVMSLDDFIKKFDLNNFKIKR